MCRTLPLNDFKYDHAENCDVPTCNMKNHSYIYIYIVIINIYVTYLN